MPRGRPQASLFRQVETYMRDMGMAVLASAWTMARRRPKEKRRKMDAVTHCSGVCTHTSPEGVQLFQVAPCDCVSVEYVVVQQVVAQ